MPCTKKWNDICVDSINGKNKRSFKQNIKDIIHDFDHLELDETVKNHGLALWARSL